MTVDHLEGEAEEESMETMKNDGNEADDAYAEEDRVKSKNRARGAGSKQRV